MAEVPKKQKEIKIIDNPVEAVRKLPDVYIGALGNAGYINMYREIVQNSLDEIIKGNTLDKNIIISFDERTHTCIVEDNGQGIEINMLVPVFSILHSSSNYDKKEGSGEYSSGKNGMGATITNYLAKFFVVESYRPNGEAGKVECNEGVLSPKGLQKIKPKKGKHGLITSFAPSEMMGHITVTIDEIYNITWLITHLCVIGTRILFNTIDRMGRTNKVIIENKNGIFELIDNICEKKVFIPAYFYNDNGTMKAEVLFSYDVANMDDPEILGFANMCPTSAGTHIDGFLDAIVKYFRDYMNKIYLANSKKLQVNAQDIRTGLRAVISVFHVNPLFTGQSKQIFSKEDMKPYIYQLTLNSLDEWAKNNPGDLQKVCKYLKEVCEIRIKSDKEKIKMSDKYVSSAVTGLPAKYKKPNGKGDFEFWIVEGDSCASAMENNRDKMHQSVFPIRGKIINAFTTPTKKYFENEEVASIFKICGYNGYQKKFNPDDFKPSKVVIAADGDPDGAHIQCLLFGLFLRYLPFVIEQGKLYAANPPLYGISIGKNKMKFFENNIDYIEYVQSVFCKENTICNMNGKKYTKQAITKILYDNMDYISLMSKACNTFAIDYDLLETILYNMNLGIGSKKFKSAIEKKFKFVKVINQNGVTIIDGLVGKFYQMVFCDDRLFSMCKELIELINHSDKFYMVNGQVVTLLGLMNLFSKFEPKNITRYKGLGEMPPKMLGESTVIPGMGRTLKRYTIGDCKKELKYITELQSDKSAFISGIKVRKEDIV